MATYYRRSAGTDDWHTASNWSTTGVGGAGDGAVPTNADNAIFQAGAANTVCGGTPAVCRDLDLSFFGGTLNAGTSLSIYGTGSLNTHLVGGNIYVMAGSTVGGTISGIAITVTLGAGVVNEAINLHTIDMEVYSTGAVTGRIGQFDAVTVGPSCRVNCTTINLTFAGTYAFMYGGGSINIGSSVLGITINGGGASLSLAAGGNCAIINNGTANSSISIGTVSTASCPTYSGTGAVTNFSITTCTSAKTFDFNGMRITNSMTINGNSNLTLTGDLNYSGSISNSNISNTTIVSSDASFGNKAYAIGAGNTDGGGNINWQIGQATASTTYDLETFPAVNKLHDSTGECWRFAAKTIQGQGWNRNNGTAWIWPEPLSDSLRIFNANNEVINVVLDEVTGKWYQTDVRIAPTNSAIVNSYEDKKATGVDGTEIATAFKLGEHVGQDENQIVEHLETHIRIRPRDESLRNTTGYDANGLRNAFAVTVEGFVDGVQTASRQTEDVPFGGDITFAEKLEGNRIQIGVSTEASEFRITSHKNDYLEKDSGGTDTQRTMAEMTYQQTLGTPLMWYSQYLNPLLNLATGVVSTGNYNSLGTDPINGSYAIVMAGENGLVSESVSLTGNFTWMCLVSGIVATTVLLKIGTQNLLTMVVAGPSYTLRWADGVNTLNQALTWDGTGWEYLQVERSGLSLIVREAN